MKTALTIAGSDSSGGAGIQADLKTFLANDVYGMSAITAITAQNTRGVQQAFILDADLLEAQIRSVFDDIRPDAVKIGMAGNSDSIKVMTRLLKEYQAENIVIDPVMVATSGAKLFNNEDADIYYHELFPLATVITPNISEAEQIQNTQINTSEDMLEVAKAMAERFKTGVLVKGGHLKDEAAIDVLAYEGEIYWYESQRIDNPNTHGTGCTLSSAIAANLAKGFDLPTSIDKAKQYLTGAIAAQLDLGRGSGPLDHGYHLR
ncbi:bifunctional hydroxymethylpyrimidine kinase/phosphomethylpyrimidine kinase [Fundicoccus culcitae]|uniref:Hydroxymethylpyrimidine/phosphomethylpyrimidine kinase n=1 Tax=Fundicoccus culcitae TaxID=2969821 RepID=A0ABY5P7R6_9LACT|nr:bifunctional hydroxymethylpyrimidine kinase/phosphomethylpyrimidine kinase [Fundicoccus culcitae]UUX34779.1 bifunctional hydroxymethylpyrimidine kinase/phosphomethylpyrimidine kinase [Fundicoccus culcitae]